MAASASRISCCSRQRAFLSSGGGFSCGAEARGGCNKERKYSSQLRYPASRRAWIISAATPSLTRQLNRFRLVSTELIFRT